MSPRATTRNSCPSPRFEKLLLWRGAQDWHGLRVPCGQLAPELTSRLAKSFSVRPPSLLAMSSLLD